MELHDASDKLFTEIDHLDRVLPDDLDDLTEDTTNLALSIAKRVRTTSTLLVRALAERRDQLQP
jgi:hypothetical protein